LVKKAVGGTGNFTLILLLAFFTQKGKENVKHVESWKSSKKNGRFLYSTKTGNTPMMDAFTAMLEARDPTLGRFRAYRLEAGTDLLGDWLVEITYGRIGTRGRHIRYAVQDETQARKLVCDTLRRRASARKRIGVAHRFCQLIDPHQWFPVTLSN
jgi:WGR domain-containing protein